MKTLHQFLNRVDHQKNLHPTLRWGQIFFNILSEERPLLADAIRGSEIDPFYFDKGVKTAMAIKWVSDRW